MFDFDKVIDRRGTGSIKVDLIQKNQLPEDTIPLWVADMDFETAPEIREALTRLSEYGIYGYSMPQDSYFTAVHDWFFRRFGWEVREEWMLQTPGVVFALATAVRAFTEENDRVLIQRPVYYPFTKVVEQNNRVVVNSPLVYENGSYHIDFEDFENKIVSENVKLFILCNPHNPVGRVWAKEELQRMGEICIKHDVFVVADEIHCDFIRKDYQHTNFATLGEDFEQNCMICTAPSKTFNLAGLQISNIFIPNEEKRELMQKELDRVGFHGAGLFGMAACEAAYTYGEKWLEELLLYLEGNLEYIRDYVKEKLPKVKIIEPEGTYLLWLDVSAYGYTQEELKERLRSQVRVWLDEGDMFGVEGNGFVRVNIASPRAVIAGAMERFLQL